MIIEKLKYQCVPLNKKDFIKDSKWYDYYNAIFEKNYFIENELEFLKALKSDLEKEINDVDKSIKILQKKS
jgi:hypothetical protein